ncbi:MAG: hypothetical protein QF876_07240 [Desulfobacterales bacterium]|nr:hypothetical protein [Desulfobacterales bacterium]MDP6808101.1 hypothetical protein [Desulfobacterales bacterium]|tara:strand:+ start:234 stop:1664 length:1431 start_codon:yes stop_codon:yes gene_type:complete
MGVAGVVILQLIMAMQNLTTHWLADQSNLAQHFLYFHDWFFYGPYFSGTSPIVFGLGPVATFLFSFPGMLGFSPDVMHRFVIIINTLGIVAIAWSLRQKHSERTLFFIFSLLLFFAHRYWWILTIFWINSLLVALSLFFISSMINHFKNPKLNSLLILVSLSVLPLHIHSTPSFVLPVTIYAIVYYFLHVRKWEALRLYTWALWGITFLPLFLGELMNGFYNTRAIFQNIRGKTDHAAGIISGKQALDSFFIHNNIQFSWFSAKDYGNINTWIGIILVLFVLWYIIFAVRQNDERNWHRHFWRCFPFVMVFHFLFFYVFNRPIVSGHYLSFSTVFYVLPLGLIINSILSKLKLNSVIVLFLVVLWITLGQSFHSEREKDYWNYGEIKEILLDTSMETNSLCTIEGPHFSVVPGKKYNSVEYLLRRGLIKGISYNPESSFCLYVNRSGDTPDEIVSKNATFRLLRRTGKAGLYTKKD